MADGLVTALLSASDAATATDPAGNTAVSPTYSFTVDSEPGVTPVLSFTTNVIDAAADSAWPLTVSGLDDETGTVRFADAFGHSASVNVTGNGTYSTDLSSLKDGPATSTLSLSDPAGNQWSVPGGALTMVGAPVPGSTLVQLPSSSTGNLGTVGPNGPTVIDASQTHGVTFQSGNGPDTMISGPNDTVFAGNGPDTLVGATGAALHAGTGPQTLYGAPGDTLFSGRGPDTFAFEPGFGLDTIVNFKANEDVLQINPSLIANFAAAMLDGKQMGLDTVFTVDPNDKITLQGVNLSNLTSSNFHFS
jgi:hypothetical protein